MILIAGIGNIFIGDDGFGSEVARRIGRRPTAAGVRVVDFGIRGLDLAFAPLDDYDTIIIVDAAQRGGVPGTIYLIDPDVNELDSNSTIEAHLLDPMRVLALAHSMGAALKMSASSAANPKVSDPWMGGVWDLVLC